MDNSKFLFTRDMMVFDKSEWTPFNCLDWADESAKLHHEKCKHYRQRRCDYFYKKINEIEDNEKLKYDIFMRLKKVSGDLFNWSYLEDTKDCFIEVIDTLFDSDSYIELNNKLEAIEAASNFCKTSYLEIDTFRKLLKRLKSDRYKDSSNDKIIKYSDDASKPKKIIDRMKALYVNIFDDDLDRVHNNCDNIFDLVLSLGKVNKDINVNDYIEFCNKYINKIERDLENSLILFSKSENVLLVATEPSTDSFLSAPPVSFRSDNWEERKEYIINKLKELGLHKEFRDKFISCYEKNKYGFLNLYMIAITYEFQKNNFENFRAILDDMVVVSDYCTEFTASEFFKYFVGYFLVCEDYKDMVNMRESFSRFLSGFDGRYYDSVVYDVAKIGSYQKFEDNYIANEMNSLNMRKVFDRREVYRDKFLTKRRGRLTYINNKLYEVESNKNLRDKLFSDICDLSIEMLCELNTFGDRDIFLECMEIVFDSDTYYELNKKMSLLKETSVLFCEGMKIEALRLIRNLNSDDNKEVLNGKVVSYPKNSINVIDKPKRIIDRMKYLYSRIDDSMSYDFLDEVHDKAVFSEDIDRSVVLYRNKFGNKVKRLFVNSKRKKK